MCIRLTMSLKPPFSWAVTGASLYDIEPARGGLEDLPAQSKGE